MSVPSFSIETIGGGVIALFLRLAQARLQVLSIGVNTCSAIFKARFEGFTKHENLGNKVCFEAE